MSTSPICNPRDYTTSLIAFMKVFHSLDDLATKSLRMLDDSGKIQGYLVPLSAFHLDDPVLIASLAAWRQDHQDAYPSRFEVTIESTGRWLTNAVVANQDRILFLVTDFSLSPIGHLGVVVDSNGSLEVDNVLRGVSHHPGIMQAAMKVLEEWCLNELDAQSVTLRVLESNSRAMRFYARLGYEIVERQPLAWIDEADRQVLIPTSGPADDTFVTMRRDLQSTQTAALRILTAGPLIGVREATFTLDATRTGWNTHHSDYLNRFENEFAGFLGTEHAMATSSCTGALHLALLALGIGAGDEVIVPETTWVATAAAVAYTGATPVFVDVDPTTWTMTAATMEPAISERTRAVIPVHLYGYPCDMPSIMDLAQLAEIRVVEDAAPAIGALVDGRNVGTFGDFGCFSFQGAKMLVTGQGGMLVTRDRQLRDRTWKQQDHGRQPGTFWIDELGRQYKMSNLTAALGLGQLSSAEVQISKKRRIRAWYAEGLSDISAITLQQERADTRSICWMTSLVIDEESGKDREGLVTHLHSKGIDSRPVFPPISHYPIWGHSPNALAAPIAERLGRSAINLPSGVTLSRPSIDRVIDAVRTYFEA